ncbi:helicase-related protein, partial [Rhodobacter lacus]
VAKSLKTHGFNAAPIHGDLEQSQRMRTLDAFRDGTLQLLVASDVAARGLDIPAVSHVFNYDLPSHAEDYVHRIGRTGRAGRLGTAISIGTPADGKYLGAIESLVKMKIPRAETPEGFALSEAAHREPKKYDDDKGGRSGRSRSARGGRDRDRTRDEKRAPRPEREKPAEKASVEEVIVEADESLIVEVPEAKREPSRRDDRREERRDDRRDRGGRYRDSGPAVVGMGDHVPDFLMRSFRPSTKPVAEAPETTEVEETSES